MKISSPFFALTCMLFAGVLASCQATQDLGGPGTPVVPDAGIAAPIAPLGLRAFVTSASYKGDLVNAAGGDKDGLTAADSLCNAAAKGAGLTGEWIAYLSSGADSAKDHVVDEGPFYAVDGKTKLFSSKLGVGGGAEVEIPDEKGSKPIDVFVGHDKFGDITSSTGIASFWTGSTAAGEVAATCKSWTSSDLFDDGNDASHLGASTVLLSCENEHHLLCLEQHEARAGRVTKRVFVTRKVFNGDFGGLVGADSQCAAAASEAGLKGTFIAWLSGRDKGAVVRAADRLDEARYAMLDGTVAFESKAQFTAGPSAPIMITELGTALDNISDINVWTGTLSSGTPSPDYRCLDWTSADRDDAGIAGDVGRGGTDWSSTRSPEAHSCRDANHLYCFEK